jgi:hypothetical protein
MTGRAAHNGAWARTWADALTAAELDLEETEAVLARLHADADFVPEVPAPWAPPTGLGPLPASEAERARAVLARQRRVAVELTAAMVGNRQHRRITASAAQRSAAVPIYVDTAV